MAVLGTSAAATGTCQYPFLRLMVENTFMPFSFLDRSSICGGGCQLALFQLFQ